MKCTNCGKAIRGKGHKVGLMLDDLPDDLPQEMRELFSTSVICTSCSKAFKQMEKLITDKQLKVVVKPL